MNRHIIRIPNDYFYYVMLGVQQPNYTADKFVLPLGDYKIGDFFTLQPQIEIKNHPAIAKTYIIIDIYNYNWLDTERKNKENTNQICYSSTLLQDITDGFVEVQAIFCDYTKIDQTQITVIDKGV